jgi:hypothetical protein
VFDQYFVGIRKNYSGRLRLVVIVIAGKFPVAAGVGS